MHRDVVIMCDSVCDLPKDIIDKLGVHVIPLGVSMGDSIFKDGVDVSSADIFKFYEESNELPKTSAFSIGEVEDLYRQYTNDGKSVVHISLGSKLSSCYQNACIASEDIGEVFIVDSNQITTGIAQLIIEACKLRDEGYCARMIVHRLNEFKDKVATSCVIESLEYLCSGGRCSSVANFGANALRIRPSIEMRSGELKVGKRYRGKMESVYKKYIDDIINTNEIDTSYPVFITSAGIDSTEVQNVEEFIRANVPDCDIITTSAGCTVSTHCGPGTLGVVYIRK